MDLSDEDVQQFAEADRRAVDPPIQVKAGQLDWWVKERQQWWGRVRGARAPAGVVALAGGAAGCWERLSNGIELITGLDEPRCQPRRPVG
jgi:hypothetical protein